MEKLTEHRSREYPKGPILAVSAVVLHEGSVLLVRRENAPLAGEWALPGGVVELGETLAHAVIRELREETGLRVEPLTVLDALDKIDCDIEGLVRYHYLIVCIHCRWVAGALHASTDARDARWACAKEAGIANDFTLSADIYRLIKLALQRENDGGSQTFSKGYNSM